MRTPSPNCRVMSARGLTTITMIVTIMITGTATIGTAILWPDVERVTERNTGYWVVEMKDRAGELAQRANPRSHEGPLSLRT